MFRRTLLLVVLTAAGCGPSAFSVSGRVTYNGEPVEEGSIVFDAPDGSTSSVGGRIEKGAYSITGVPAAAGGKKVVRIFAARKTGRKIEAGPPTPPGTLVDELKKLPARYNEQSRHPAELSASGSNALDYDLSDDKPW